MIFLLLCSSLTVAFFLQLEVTVHHMSSQRRVSTAFSFIMTLHHWTHSHFSYSSHLAENSDQSSIFQLGLVLLELITGQSSETGGVDLVHWVRESHVPRSINRMIDPDLGNDYNNTELKVLLAVARLCIDSVDEPSSSRNNKSQILRYLKTQIAPTRARARSCWLLNMYVLVLLIYILSIYHWIFFFFPLLYNSSGDYNAFVPVPRCHNGIQSSKLVT